LSQKAKKIKRVAKVKILDPSLRPS